MTAYKQKKPDVITYGDHEVITPDHTRLRQTVRQATPEEESEDPVARADEVVEALYDRLEAVHVAEVILVHAVPDGAGAPRIR